MEQIIDSTIELFGAELPSIDELQQLNAHVHSGNNNDIDFRAKLDANLEKNGAKENLVNGIALYILDDDEQAIKKLKKARDCAQKFLYLAYACRRSGDFENAITNLDNCLANDISAETVALEKAETFRTAGDFELAKKEIESCSALQETSADYNYQFGRLCEVQGQYEQAVEYYNKAIELDPDHQKALFHLAYRCDMNGDEEAAIDYYKQIVTTSPANVSALLNLAVLYEDAEKYEKASACVERVLQFHPNHQRAQLFKKDIDSSKTMFFDEEKEKKKTHKTQLLETPISDFELSVRSRNCLCKMNIATVGDLLNITEAELLSYKNFGETSLREIKAILDSKALHLGMMLEQETFTPDLNNEEIPDSETKLLLQKPVEDLQLSVRAQKALQKLNILTLTDLVRRTEAELLGCKNFGVTSLNEIKKALTNIGLALRSLE